MAKPLVYDPLDSSGIHIRSNMGYFSIKDLERFSGIKAHTIRIWEQRYHLLAPQRTEGNTRLYSLEQVHHLLDIALLTNKGNRISALVEITPTERERKIQSLGTEEDKLRIAIHYLIIYKYAGDIEKFEDILDSCVLNWGIDTTIQKVIIPFMEKAELLSYSDKSCETHFAVTAIRRKIILGIEQTRPALLQQQSALLFLAEGEHYDLILLYAAFLLKREGIRILYLGTNVSLENLKKVIVTKAPQLLINYVPQRQKFKLHGLVAFMAQYQPGVKLHVATCDTVLVHQNIANVQFLHFKDVATVVNA
jgi:DNA-binding transcriptional MerR regulator